MIKIKILRNLQNQTETFFVVNSTALPEEIEAEAENVQLKNEKINCQVFVNLIEGLIPE